MAEGVTGKEIDETFRPRLLAPQSGGTGGRELWRASDGLWGLSGGPACEFDESGVFEGVRSPTASGGLKFS